MAAGEGGDRMNWIGKFFCMMGWHFGTLRAGATLQAGLTVIKKCDYCGRLWYDRAPDWAGPVWVPIAPGTEIRYRDDLE